MLDEKVSPNQTKFAFTTPPLTGIVADKDYKVTLRLLDADGKELEKIEKNFRSQLDQALLPEKPLTIGPGYTKNPEANRTAADRPTSYTPQRSAAVWTGASQRRAISSSSSDTVIEQPAISSEVT